MPNFDPSIFLVNPKPPEPKMSVEDGSDVPIGAFIVEMPSPDATANVVEQEYINAVENVNIILAGRNISDLTLDDPYWEAQRAAQLAYAKFKDN